MKLTYETIRNVNITQQETENIKTFALANITSINANASYVAAKILNFGQSNVTVTSLNYTTAALKEVQSKLNFTDPKTALIEYFYYQKLNLLKSDTKNKLIVGQTNATVMTGK
jgi:hypothetical protein